MDTKLTISDLKPISLVLYSIIVTCFSSYALAETMLVKNFAVFFLFVSVSCLSVCFFFCQKNQKTPKRSSTLPVEKNYNNDIKKALSIFNTGVKKDLELIRQHLVQIKSLVNDASSGLTEKFYSISSRIDQQQRLMDRFLDKCNELSMAQTAEQVKMINHFVKEDAGNCIRALQFEDIVSQVSDHCALYLDDVEKYLANLRLNFDALENGKLMNKRKENPGNPSATFENNSECSSSKNRTNIAQHNLSAGNIELF